MKKIWIMIIGLLILSMNLLAQEAPMQDRRGMRGDRPMHMMQGKGRRGGGKCQGLIHQQLGLSDEQAEKIKEIKKNNMKERHKIRQKLQNYKHLLKVEMMEDDPDVSEIKSLAKKIGDLEEKKIVTKVEQLNKLKSILTKEQFKKLNFQMMFKQGGKRGKGRHGRRGGQRQQTR